MAQETFTTFTSPTGHSFFMPADITLQVPKDSEINHSLLNFLVYIPWDNKYLENVPAEYRDFFKSVLPHLSVRTTDVHVATCIPFIKELGQGFTDEFNEQVVYIALILHDIGWSRLSEREIASSLGVTGLAITPGAAEPKEKHANLGKKLAKQILHTYKFEPPLTIEQKELILDAVQFHDKPWELSHGSGIPLEMKLVCDIDHLWSFTHLNFWQDTVRKSMDPKAYLQNLARDLDGYFITQQAKDMARYMLSQRKAEVNSLPDHKK